MFDKKRFANIIHNISNSYENNTALAEASDVNRTYISKIINLKLNSPPTPKVLKKIANNSKGLTTYEELMEVCGYISYESNSEEIEFIINKLKDLNLDEKELHEVIEYANKKPNISVNIKPEDYKSHNDYLYDKHNLRDDVKFALERKLSKKQHEAYYLLLSLGLHHFGVDNLHTILFNKNNAQSTIKIPIFQSITSSDFMLDENNIVDYEELSIGDFLDGEYFGFKVNDDSMFPRILNGDLLIVKKQNNYKNGEVVLILTNNNEVTVKRIQNNNNGITLISTNPMYPEIYFTKEDISNNSITILGVVKKLITSNL